MPSKKDIGTIFKEGKAIDKALREASLIAAWKHKQLGVPMAVWNWESGKVMMIPPSEIKVPARIKLYTAK